ncbi:MAG: adenine deaminase [Synergistaceae bacterium]|nr:adenine deaminase [Synergistaceae bacterium]
MNKLAAAARGEIPAELVIHNARIANILTQSYELADVAIQSGKIAGIAEHYEGDKNFDASGRVLIPSFIDGHVHIEDTFMTPPNFAKIAAIHGTGSVFADPHEISNALGLAGLEFMFAASLNRPINIFFGAPSCVPASEFETPYEELDINAIKAMFDKNLVTHLGEMMNFPAIISGDSEAWAKVLLAGKLPVTGHAPGVSGKALNAYISAGISSDHECTDLNEAREKLSRGMFIMIREGSSFRDLKTLLPLIRENPLNACRCMIVSDDITARDLLTNGHMDSKLRIMLREGINPFVALRMITLTPAEYFRVYNLGLIAPGYNADFVLLGGSEINEDFTVNEVWKDGRLIVRDKDVFDVIDETEHLAPVIKTRVKNIPSESQIRIPVSEHEGELINVIGITEGTTITKTLNLVPKVREGFVVPDPDNDVAKIAVLERHRDTGQFAAGFVKGLGIRRGAIGSSVAHDAHNFVAAGSDDESIITAFKALAEIGGGLVITEGKNVIASFGLPIGGLMCYLPPEKIAAELANMETTAENFGVKIPHPFMVLSFLCLSVIPELRITDQGYIDITKGGRQDIFVR